MDMGTSSLAVTAVLWMLLLFSVASWTVIFVKGWKQWRLGRANRVFAERFWHASDLEAAAGEAQHRDAPLARLCLAGTRELSSLRAGTNDLAHRGEVGDILERTLRQQVQKEQTAMEGGLTLLASVGSISPFVGLFGTVWGIMHALQDIARSGSAGLDVVAGPVGEALIATALGIATAIPAVLAYNFFLRRVRVGVAEMEHFAADFLHLVLKSERKGGR
jgi:biopolymer transport protein ExbB